MSKSLENFERDDKTAKFPFLVLAVSILLTVGVTYIFFQSARNKDLIRFNNEVNRLQATIENKVNLYIALLEGGRAVVESNNVINREHFAKYAESLNLEKNYTSIRGIGYVKVISAAERQPLLEKMETEAYEGFQIFPAAEKDFYQIIVYLEPLNERNRKLLGFDISSEAKTIEALELARDSGEAASSARANSESGDGVSNAEVEFSIFLPIYKNGKLPASIEERRKNIAGYIFSSFHAADFLREIQNGNPASDILLKIYDGPVMEGNLLAQSDNLRNLTSRNEIEQHHTTQREQEIAGRKWIIQYSSLPEFFAQSSVRWAPMIFIIGIIFSFLLFGMTYWEASARIKLQATAADLYETEQQKQGLLEKEQAARRSAERAYKTKDEFIAVVSHELRTPLNAIGGWTRILKTEDLSENTKKLALEKIEKNLRAQTKLVEELLDYSQIVSGTIKFDGKEVNFSDVFENIFLEVEPSALEKRIELLKDNQLNGHLILGDEDKIKIVIYNLLTNAVKFTHSGGRIETSVRENEGTIQMTVKDNGRGIDSDFLPHVFDRFTQADASSTRASGGLGLGLTISNHIVKLHDGKIEVNSEGTGKGATFTVTVPHYKRLDNQL